MIGCRNDSLYPGSLIIAVIREPGYEAIGMSAFGFLNNWSYCLLCSISMEITTNTLHSL